MNIYTPPKNLLQGITDSKEVLLFGISALSERIAYYIDCGESIKPFSVKGFVVDDDYYSADNFAGKKIYRYSEAKEKFLRTTSIIICIGYKNMNENRKKIFHRLLDDGWDIESFISSQAVIYTEAIGTGNIFLSNSLIEYNSVLGDCNIFDSAHLGHHSRVGSFNFFCYSSVTGGSVKIGNCCFIGMNATVKSYITLLDKTLVGAGCYLRHDTAEPSMCYAPPEAVYLGESELIVKKNFLERN